MTGTMQFVPIVIVAFAISLGLTPLSRQIAMRLGVVDKPNQRKIHLENKPLMGGMAIYVGLALALLLFSPPRHLTELGAVLAGATFLALVGLIDDRYELRARTKLAAQVIAALGLVFAGIKMQLFGVPLLDGAATVFWVFALTNAINYLDNMDGLSAGTSAIAAFFFMIIAISQGLILVSILAAAVFGSAMGFLVYNFNPSSTFMGDMGSLPLGFILSVLAIKLRFDQPFSLLWLVPVFTLALPVFDVNLVTFTRIFEGRSPAQAGKDHTSHRLLSIGFGQRQTLFVLYGSSTIFGVMALLMSAAPQQAVLRLAVFGLLLLAGAALFMIWARQRFQKGQPGPPVPAPKPTEMTSASIETVSKN